MTHGETALTRASKPQPSCLVVNWRGWAPRKLPISSPMCRQAKFRAFVLKAWACPSLIWWRRLA